MTYKSLRKQPVALFMTIQLKDVRFAYTESPHHTVLQIESWSVSAKEQVFVHGPSGGGKSTLLNLLSGMLQAPTGEISILGERLDKMSARKRDRFRANHIGYIFQQFNLIPYLDAIDNNTVVENEPGIDLAGWLECVHCTETSEVKLPLGASFFWPDVE